MPQKEISQLEIDSLLASINSPKTIEKLNSFFEESVKLQRLRDYASGQGD